ncbi:MAG: RDD family protein [Verrucomicrobiota bacterium]
MDRSGNPDGQLVTGSHQRITNFIFVSLRQTRNMKTVSVGNQIAPSFYRRSAAAWVDIILLVGIYIIFGFIFRHIFDASAYPKPTGMQLYSERDFAVYWFFVRTTVIFVILYMSVSYFVYGVTFGQKMAQIRYLPKVGEKLQATHIVRRIITVLIKVFIVFFPGPIAAFLFIAIGFELLNPAFSMLLLVCALFGLLYASITRYNRGKTASWSDKFSKTYLVDLRSSRD